MTTICKVARAVVNVPYIIRVGNNAMRKNYSSCCPSDCPSMYDCRKYGHQLPCDSVAPPFDTLPCIPTGVFRCTAGETLGPGAGKCCLYKDPEYYSFHHMSFFDLNMVMQCCRLPQPKTGRKP